MPFLNRISPSGGRNSRRKTIKSLIGIRGGSLSCTTLEFPVVSIPSRASGCYNLFIYNILDLT